VYFYVNFFAVNKFDLKLICCVGGNKFVYHSLNDGNLYQHDAETNDSRVVMDESIFVRLARLLILKSFTFVTSPKN